MVRFAWASGNGALAYVKRKQVSVPDGTSCLQFAVDVELTGKHSLAEATFVLPPSWSSSNKVHELGVFIAPGSQKVDNKDTLCSRLAISLAKAGHLVVRAPYEGGGFPQGNMVQKAFEAAVLSPYATGVRQWIFIGYSLGGMALCRIGLSVGDRIAAFCLISYPLQHELCDLENAAFKSPLVKRPDPMLMYLRPPVLLVQPDADEAAPFGSIVEVASSMRSVDVRMLHLKDTDHALRVNKQPVTRSTLRKVSSSVTQFVAAVRGGSLAHFPIKPIRRMGAKDAGPVPPSAPDPNAPRPQHMIKLKKPRQASPTPKRNDNVEGSQRRGEEVRKRMKVGEAVDVPSPRHRELEDLEDLIPDDVEGSGGALELNTAARRGVSIPEPSRAGRDAQEVGGEVRRYEEPAVGFGVGGQAEGNGMAEYQRAGGVYGQRQPQQQLEDGGIYQQQHPGGGMFRVNNTGVVASGGGMRGVGGNPVTGGLPLMQQQQQQVQLHELGGGGQMTGIAHAMAGQGGMLGGRHPGMDGMQQQQHPRAPFYGAMPSQVPPQQAHFSGMQPGQLMYGWSQPGGQAQQQQPPQQQQHMHPGYDANGVPSAIYDQSGRQLPPGANYLNYQYMQRFGQ